MKRVRVRSFSGPYFPEFGLNTEKYFVFLRVQPEYGKIRTRKNPNTDTFHAVLLVTFRSTALLKKTPTQVFSFESFTLFLSPIFLKNTSSGCFLISVVKSISGMPMTRDCSYRNKGSVLRDRKHKSEFLRQFWKTKINTHFDKQLLSDFVPKADSS